MEFILSGVGFLLLFGTLIALWLHTEHTSEIHRSTDRRLSRMEYEASRGVAGETPILADVMGTRLGLNPDTVNILKGLPEDKLVEIAFAVAQDDIIKAQDDARKRNFDPASTQTETPVEDEAAIAEEASAVLPGTQEKWE